MTQQTKSYRLRPRWLKVLLDIWENRTRTTLVVASIAVGVFAVGMIISAYVIIEEDMLWSYTTSNPANIEIRTTGFDDTFIQTIEKMPEISEAEGRHQATMRISQDGGSTWSSLNVIAIDDYEDSSIYLRTPVEGQIAPQDREMIMEQRILDEFDVELGDQLLIQLSNGTTREIPVTGFVMDQSIPGGPNNNAIAYITMDTLTWLGESRSFNQIMAITAENGNDLAHVEAVSADIEEKIKDSNRPVLGTTYNLSDEHPNQTTVLAILSVLGAMGALMLILGGSLIANTLSALLNQQMRQIGVMKLVGARNMQVISMYLVLIILLSLLSLSISIPLASFAGYAFAVYFSDLLNITVQGFRFIPASIVTQIVIAIFIPILAGVVPVVSGARRSVEDAISDSAASTSSGKEGWFDTLGETLEWISRPVLISIRNTFRNVKRLSLTLFTLTMAGSIFIGVFNVQSSLNNYTDSVRGLFIADLAVTLSRPYREEELIRIVEEVPGVVEVEGWLTAIGEVPLDNGEDLGLTILAPPSDTELLYPSLKEGRLIEPGDENAIIVAETIWEEYPGLAPGDTIELSLNGEREESWTVVGIFTFPGRAVDTIVSYAPYETIEQKTNQTGQVSSLRIVSTDHSLEGQEALGDLVDSQLQASGIQFESIEAGQATIESVNEAVNVLISFFLGMAILTAIVGSIGLAGTMSMNVMERIREIGILRAIGAVDSAVMQSVMIEGVFVGVISWIFALVINFPISYGLLTMVSQALTNSQIALRLSPTGYWLWIVVILVLSAVASIMPARNASRLTIREVLAYE